MFVVADDAAAVPDVDGGARVLGKRELPPGGWRRRGAPRVQAADPGGAEGSAPLVMVVEGAALAAATGPAPDGSALAAYGALQR